MIPVYINVFNRLTTTRKIADQIAAFDNAIPIIIDNDSTYEPLLEWYQGCPYEVIRLKENLGHHAPWKSGYAYRDRSAFYAVTDCDLDLEGIPADAMSVLMEPFSWKNRNIVKSGFGLRIDDLPEWQATVIHWENRFWERRVSTNSLYYWAAIDTTFALYSIETPEETAMKTMRVKSVRTGGKYIARHSPWYLDSENMDEENRNYFATANGSNSWKPSGKHLAGRYSGSRK